MTWLVTTSGSSVSAPVSAAGSLGIISFTGALAGTLSGSTLTFTITIPTGSILGSPNCSASITGSANNVTATTIAGTYTGTNSCTGGLDNGQFTLNKP
jgi:hypothetical protein